MKINFRLYVFLKFILLGITSFIILLCLIGGYVSAGNNEQQAFLIFFASGFLLSLPVVIYSLVFQEIPKFIKEIKEYANTSTKE